MIPVFHENNVTVFNTDARRLPDLLPQGGAHAIVTDPPYELRLNMSGGNAHYDATGVSFDPLFWNSLLPLVRPGGFLMAFGAPRTWHRLACAVEDAGWLIRDQICWLYESGMPKGEWAAHAVDRALGVDDTRPVEAPARGVYHRRRAREGAYRPVAEEARAWVGWNPTLKPAWEPILVAQRPREGVLGRNLLDHGAGALHVGEGAYPSNVIADMCPAFMLQSKAPARERPSWQGLAGAPRLRDDAWRRACGRHGLTPDGRDYPLGLFDPDERGLFDRVRVVSYAHPTVKPLALMRRLVHLTVPRGGLVVDPFSGSGSTLEAARLEGVRAVGCDIDPMNLPLIKARLDRPASTPLF